MNSYSKDLKAFLKKLIIIYFSIFGIWLVFALIGTFIGLPAFLGGMVMVGYWILLTPTKILFILLLPGINPMPSLSGTEGNFLAIWISATIVNIVVCLVLALTLAVIKSLLRISQKSA